MHRTFSTLPILCCLFFTFSMIAFGSGSYIRRLPSPPLPTGEHRRDGENRARYDLGQRVFFERMPLNVQAEAETQQGRLEALQSKLPPRWARTKNLATLAGRLSESQLSALEYYVNERFGNSK